MPRPDKVAVVDEVKKDLAGSAATLLTHYRGLTVTELAELRARLREAGAEYRVVKNTLTRRAAEDAGIEGLAELLVGPTALVFCAEDPVGPSKALKAFAKDHPDLLVRGGYLDGEVLDEAAAIKLADLSSKDELLAQLVGLMYGALANTAGCCRPRSRSRPDWCRPSSTPAATPTSPRRAAAPAATEEPRPAEAPAEEPAAEAPRRGRRPPRTRHAPRSAAATRRRAEDATPAES